MKIIPMIQARMGSTRFYGKVLAPLWGSTVIDAVIGRAKQLQELGTEPPVLLTSKEREDDILERWADYCGIGCYREHNIPLRVLDWYLHAAEKLQPDYIIRLAGDAPLTDMELSKELLEEVRRNPECDYYSHRLPDGRPVTVSSYGIFPEIFRYPVEVLRIGLRAGLLSLYQEHVAPLFYLNDTAYKCCYIPIPEELAATPFKGTIDVPADLERLEAMYGYTDRLAGDGWRATVALVQHRPELAGDCMANIGNVEGTRYGK
jgi:spore coat polysaccharide biosynthesis protein SpsF